MDVTVIVWLVVIAAILAAMIGTAIMIRRHTSDDDTAPRRLPDPRDRGFFE